MLARLRNILRRASLILVTMVLILVVSELILQATEIGSFSQNRRVLFYSQPSFKYLDKEVVHYHPNSAIRTVAVYGDHIDYDVTNRTNNLGFFDDVDYLAPDVNARNIAFIGNSFTSGSGGTEPWVTKLRRSIKQDDVTLYNLGVSATGFHNFSALLDHYSEQLAINEVNIMMLTGDLYRAIWYPLTDDDGVRMCWNRVSPGKCRTGSDITMLPVSKEATHEDILAESQEIYSRSGANTDQNKSFIQHVRLYNLFCNAAHKISKDTNALLQRCPHLRGFQIRRGPKDIMFKYSLDLLNRMKNKHPGIRFRLFHVPEKSEAFHGRYAVNVVKEMKKLEIDYVSLLFACDWKPSHFHKHDGHPNDRGYEHLAACVKPYL